MTKNLSIKIAIFILMCSSIFHAQTSTDFVRLECGKMLDGNGQPFYPVICNYSMAYLFQNCTNGSMNCGNQTSCSSYVLTPASHYGPTIYFECTDQQSCSTSIANDLAKIKSMGFNMIRPAFTPHWDYVCGKLFVVGYGNPAENLEWQDHKLYFDQPYASDPDVLNYFQNMESLMNLAAQYGLKTMINGMNSDASNPVITSAYLEYLTELGNYFKNNQNLAFYDFLSEPSYTYLWGLNEQNNNNYSKENACTLVSGFYDVLKAADPNHLISAGNNGYEEVNLFDPGVTKMDFSQPHFYGRFLPYDFSIPHYQERLFGHLWWISKNCPVPWLAGEFSFRAIEDQTQIAYYEGTLADQKSITDEMLAYSRNVGSLGFTWWEYQDEFWEVTGYPPIPQGINLPHGWGLIKALSDITDNIPDEKPVVESFRNYLNPVTGQPPPIPVAPPGSTVTVGPQKPASYYDPYYNGQFNPGHINSVSGIITDADGNPIEDAVVFADNWLYLDDKGTPTIAGDDENILSNLYTFTDATGAFEIIPYNFVAPNDHRIVRLTGSAVGTEYFQRGGPSWPAGDVAMISDIGIVVLDKVQQIEVINDVYNKIIPVGQTENYRAKELLVVRNTSILGNSTSGGNSEMKARCEVVLGDQFSAEYGSEVQAFNTEVYNDCIEYSAFSNARLGSGNNNPKNTIPPDRTISLLFQNSELPEVFVFPNPSKGIFNLSVKNLSDQDPTLLTLFNCMGEKLQSQEIRIENSLLDLTDFADGLYFLEVKLSGKAVMKKIVVNK
jgi:hypothetical protein